MKSSASFTNLLSQATSLYQKGRAKHVETKRLGSTIMSCSNPAEDREIYWREEVESNGVTLGMLWKGNDTVDYCARYKSFRYKYWAPRHGMLFYVFYFPYMKQSANAYFVALLFDSQICLNSTNLIVFLLSVGQCGNQVRFHSLNYTYRRRLDYIAFYLFLRWFHILV